MGGTTAPAADVDIPATRLFVTPAGEIALCCRLALAARLEALLPDEALRFLLGEEPLASGTQGIELGYSPGVGAVQRTPAPFGQTGGTLTTTRTMEPGHGRGPGDAGVRWTAPTPVGVPDIEAGATPLHVMPTGSLSNHPSRSDPDERPLNADAHPGWDALLGSLDSLSVLDPACGPGDFLLGMLEVLAALEAYVARRLGRPHDPAATRRRICGQQLFGVEVQGARLSTARLRLREAGGVEPALVRTDSLLPDDDFSWQRLRAHGFDIVLGNPPYVRHEWIADPLGRHPPPRYREAVVQRLRDRLPGILGLKDGTAQCLLDRRSDLSVLFLLLGISLLHPEGALAFVLPSSLVQTRYGARIGHFLARSNRHGILIESLTHRSFAGAEINTAVLLAAPGAPDDRAPPLRRVELEGRPDGAQAATIWRAAHQAPAGAACSASQAPTVRLAELGRLRYPIKSGLNRFFFLDAVTVTAFGIEDRYCRPILKSPRDVDAVLLDPGTLPTLAFVCSDEPDALGPGAAHYIEWGSRQRNARGVFWPNAPSLRGRKRWYSLPLLPPADVLVPRFFDRRLFVVLPRAPVLEDQTFYGLILAPEQARRRELIAALLTCSLTCLALETHGRTGLGDGVRQYALCDYAELPVPDPASIPPHLVDPLVSVVRVVAARRILPAEEEMRQEDRKALDLLVAEAYGLSPRSMNEVREEIVARVRRRGERASSVSRCGRQRCCRP